MKKALTVTTLSVFCVILIAACVFGHEKFYTASDAEQLSGPPGSVIRAARIDIGIENARAWRVLYRSTGVRGQPVAVSGVIVAPRTKPPAGGYPTVAWAHPTTGIARKCAPSMDSKFAGTVPGLGDFIDRGFVVAATDYIGLAAGGSPHPYLIGTSVAHSVLNSVRVAVALAEASPEFVVWGHSQGGHAALWTGILAHKFAADLSPLGVAAAAPASELSTLFEDDLGTLGGRVFSSLALLSWSRVYGFDLETVIKTDALPSAHVLGRECLTSPLDLFIDRLALAVLPKHFLKTDPTTLDPWKTLIKRNTPNGMPPAVPVLIAQGTTDGVVLPSVTLDFARKLCNKNVSVEVVEMDAGHLAIAKSSVDVVVAWVADRLAGNPAQAGCKLPAG